MDEKDLARKADRLCAQLRVYSRRAVRKRARSSGVPLISQAAGIERRFSFSGRFAEKSLQLRSRSGIVEDLLPAFVILLGQKEPGEIGNLCSLVLRQCFANANQVLCFAAHHLHFKLITAVFKLWSYALERGGTKRMSVTFLQNIEGREI